LRKFYLYKGLANLELNNLDKALDDLGGAFSVDEKSFAVNLGLLRVNYLQEKFGSAYQKAEALKSLAQTNEEIATALYWHALVQEKRGETKDATNDWKNLLAMDETIMTAQMRTDADQHLRTMVTATNTSKPEAVTVTPKGGTATPTAKGAKAAPTPSVTLTRKP